MNGWNFGVVDYNKVLFSVLQNFLGIERPFVWLKLFESTYLRNLSFSFSKIDSYSSMY